MIHEEICAYEVCKLAKEKGFPQAFNYTHFKSGLDYYNHEEELNGDVGDILKLRIRHEPIPEEMEPITAPTQSLLQRWLREEKGIYIEVYVDWEDSIEYEMIRYSWRVVTTYRVGSHDIGGYYKNESEVYFDTYELALDDVLAYSLKNWV